MLYTIYVLDHKYAYSGLSSAAVRLYSRTILAAETVERIVVYTIYYILCISTPYTFFNVRMSISFSCGRAGSIYKTQNTLLIYNLYTYVHMYICMHS